MFCTKCGQQVPEGSKFCMYCASRIAVKDDIVTDDSPKNKYSMTDEHKDYLKFLYNENEEMKALTALLKSSKANSLSAQDLKQAIGIPTYTSVYETNPTKETSKVTLTANQDYNSAVVTTNSLLKRVEIMLEDGEFAGAMTKCDSLLDSNPTDGRVYFYMMMADLKCKTRAELINQPQPFNDNKFYAKAFKYGDENLKAELTGYTNAIRNRIETQIARAKAEKERIEAEKRAAQEAKQKNPKIGDVIYFGHDPEDNSKIWWEVLDVQDRMALIISTDAVTTTCYHHSYRNNGIESTTWKTCSIRNWLNNDFIDLYLDPLEASRIVPLTILTDKTPQNKKRKVEETIDKVFLLSIEEAERYFPNNESRDIGQYWWLRSPGNDSDYFEKHTRGFINAAYVSKYIAPSGGRHTDDGAWITGTGTPCTPGGYIGTYGMPTIKGLGIRPVICIKLD